MPVLLVILVIGVFAYAWFARRGSTLTRNCLWRQEKSAGQWRCAACGAVQKGAYAPRDCLRP
ncbi:MAG: hypothetical protein E6Q73_02640 [Pseudorhodobacter sp.]|nr:MAG: hypothetical protein E6Q73_02640 [Pseudorhodobacter sp.]